MKSNILLGCRDSTVISQEQYNRSSARVRQRLLRWCSQAPSDTRAWMYLPGQSQWFASPHRMLRRPEVGWLGQSAGVIRVTRDQQCGIHPPPQCIQVQGTLRPAVYSHTARQIETTLPPQTITQPSAWRGVRAAGVISSVAADSAAVIAGARGPPADNGCRPSPRLGPPH